jgi:hypothetical protein
VSLRKQATSVGCVAYCLTTKRHILGVGRIVRMMTEPGLIFERRAVFVIDVQKHLITGPDAVPDALEVRQVISDILKSVRERNGMARLNDTSSRKTKIVFVQHDDKDPNDPLHKGKSTWELEFNPREDDDAESLVSKDVRMYILPNTMLSFLSVDAHQD